jgi:hypothetical protein
MFNQYACQLPVAYVYIVRPLDLRLNAVVQERIAHAQRHTLRYEKLLARGQEQRLKQEREGEILALATLPRMATLSAPSHLTLGKDYVALHILGLARLII